MFTRYFTNAFLQLTHLQFSQASQTWVRLGFFLLELEKYVLFGIWNGVEFRHQILVIESPAL